MPLSLAEYNGSARRYLPIRNLQKILRMFLREVRAEQDVRAGGLQKKYYRALCFPQF